MNINELNLPLTPSTKAVDSIAERSKGNLPEYFDYSETGFSINKALEDFGIDRDSLLNSPKKERQFSPETLELYSALRNIVLSEWEDFKNDEELKKEVSGYEDEAQAFSSREIREEGLASSDALKCFEDEVRTKIFFETINKEIKGGEEVLEAGMGTGIMAIAAARAGAKKITALEINKTTAKFARRVIDRCVEKGIVNEGQIEIIAGDALKFSPTESRKFDAFISENIYTGQFHELQMQINNHLNQFVDTEKGKIIPRALVNGIELSSLSGELSGELRERKDFTLKDFKEKDLAIAVLSQPETYDIIDFSKQEEIGLRNRFVRTAAKDGKIDSVTIFSLVQMSGAKGDFIGRNETEFLNDDMVVILVPPLDALQGDVIEISISYKAADKPEQADIRVKNTRTGEVVINRKNSFQ